MLQVVLVICMPLLHTRFRQLDYYRCLNREFHCDLYSFNGGMLSFSPRMVMPYTYLRVPLVLRKVQRPSTTFLFCRYCAGHMYSCDGNNTASGSWQVRVYVCAIWLDRPRIKKSSNSNNANWKHLQLLQQSIWASLPQYKKFWSCT